VTESIIDWKSRRPYENESLEKLAKFVDFHTNNLSHAWQAGKSAGFLRKAAMEGSREISGQKEIVCAEVDGESYGEALELYTRWITTLNCMEIDV
jgi:hypothetical protein